MTLTTRLPANLRQTTREYVYLVRRGHFRSRDKDGTIRSAISKNHMLHANSTALFSIKPDFLPIEVLHCANGDFRAFFAPVTLTLTQWPSYTNLIRRPKMNFLRQCFRRLSYYNIKTHTHTYTHIHA